MNVLFKSDLEMVSGFLGEILPYFEDPALCSAFKSVADFLMSYAASCDNPERGEMDNTVYVLADRQENGMRKCFCSTGLTKVADNMTIVDKMCDLLEYEICNMLCADYGKHEGEWLPLASVNLSDKEYSDIHNYEKITFENLDKSKQYAFKCTGLGKVVIKKRLLMQLDDSDSAFFACSLEKLRTLHAYLRSMKGKLG